MVNIQDDKERLENISPVGFDLNGNVLLSSDDYYWLKEQAERVEELEKDLDEWRNEALRLFKLFEEYQERYLETKEFLKSYREALKNIYELAEYDEYDNTLEQIVSEVEKALEGTE